MRYCIKSLLFILILSLLSCDNDPPASQEALNLPSPSISEAKSKAEAKLKEVADSLREAGISGTGPKAIEAAFKLLVEGVDKKTTTASNLRAVANAAAASAAAAAKVAAETKADIVAKFAAAAQKADDEVIEAIAFAVAGIALLTDSVVLAADAASFSVVAAVVVAKTLAAVEDAKTVEDKFKDAQAVATAKLSVEEDSEYFSPALRVAAENALKKAAKEITQVENTFREGVLDLDVKRAAVATEKVLKDAEDILKKDGISETGLTKKITETFTLLKGAINARNAAEDKLDAVENDRDAAEKEFKVTETATDRIREAGVAAVDIVIAAKLSVAVAFVVKTSEEAKKDANAVAKEVVKNATDASSKAIVVSRQQGKIKAKFTVAAKIFTAAKEENSKEINVGVRPVVLSFTPVLREEVGKIFGDAAEVLNARADEKSEEL